jgi:hypothetical protein
MFSCISEHNATRFYTWLLGSNKGTLNCEAVAAVLTRLWTFKLQMYSIYWKKSIPRICCVCTLGLRILLKCSPHWMILCTHICNIGIYILLKKLLTQDNSEIVIRFPEEVRNFLLRSAQPHVQWVPSTFSLDVKWPELEADLSLPSRAQRLRSEDLVLSFLTRFQSCTVKI